jgi:ABC-type transport system involved in multi-copper enzyme maturation permease subunit
MLNYLKAEFYRVFRKRSMYIYFGALAAAYAIVAVAAYAIATVTQSYMIEADAILVDAQVAFSLLPVFVGGYLFAGLYTDDLGSKNLSALIGFGLSKAAIVLSKLILTAVFTIVVYGAVPLFMWAVYAALGHAPEAATLSLVFKQYALFSLLLTFAFSALTAIVVYGLQRGTFAMVLFVVLSTGSVSNMLGLLLKWHVIADVFPGLEQHLAYAVAMKLAGYVAAGEPVLALTAEFLAYCAVATALAVLAFRKKELEF